MPGYLTDFLFVAFMVVQTWLGCRRGLLWQAAGLAAVGFGLVLGVALAPALGVHFLGVVTQDRFHAQLLAFLLVAGLLGLGLRLLATWAEVRSEAGLQKQERERRRGHDRILGGIFGALKAFILAAVIAAAGVTLWPQGMGWTESHLAPPLAQAGARLLPEGAVEDVRAWAEHSGKDIAKGLQIQTAAERDEAARLTQRRAAIKP